MRVEFTSKIKSMCRKAVLTLHVAYSLVLVLSVFVSCRPKTHKIGMHEGTQSLYNPVLSTFLSRGGIGRP